VEQVAGTEAAPPPRRWGLLALVCVSLVLNLLVVAGAVVFVASSSAQEWVRDLVDAASEDEVAAAGGAAVRTAEEARDEARRAADLVAQGPTEADVAEAATRASGVELRVSALQTKVADLEASRRAACDWARLQETNGAGTDLENVFFDYVQTVCR
jgi:hypothetical protein